MNNPEQKNNRIKIVDVQDHATRAWTTRASFAARYATAGRQTTALTRYEERALLRSELEHRAYDRYYAIVDLTAELGLAHVPTRPSTEETLEDYIEVSDALLEMLSHELTARREVPLRDERIRQIEALKATIEGYAQGGLTIPLPTFPPATTLAEAIALHDIWKQVFSEVKAENERRMRGRELEQERLYVFLQDLRHTGYSDLQQVEASAVGFEAFVTNGVLTPHELERARTSVETLLFQARKTISDRIYWRNQEKTRREKEAAHYQALRDSARRQAEAMMSERVPLIIDLRCRDEEGEFIYRCPAQCQARLEMKVSPHHQGVPWIRMAQKKRRSPCSSRHYGNYLFKRLVWTEVVPSSKKKLSELLTNWRRPLDLRSLWRREQRKLAGE